MLDLFVEPAGTAAPIGGAAVVLEEAAGTSIPLGGTVAAAP